MAQFTASTTLRNSTMLPSPVRLSDGAHGCHGDGRIDQIAPERPQPRQNPVFVGSGQPRIADDIGHQDRGQFSRLAHGATPPRPCQPFRVVGAKASGGHRKDARGMSIIGLGMAALPCCTRKRTWKQGVQVLRVDWPVYPRRAEHNTVAERGNRRWAEIARRLTGANGDTSFPSPA